MTAFGRAHRLHLGSRTAGIGATSPFARAPAKDRSPPDPVVHFRRAKGRFAIRRGYSWSEPDQPLRVDVGFWVRLVWGFGCQEAISRARNHVVDRLPPTPQGRVQRWSVACRRAPSFRDSAADYPANHDIPVAGGPRWRRRRPSVLAVEQDAGLVARVAQDVAGAAGRGAGLAVGLSSSGQRRGGVWTCGIPIVNRYSHVSQDDPRGTRQWTQNIASTLLSSGVWSRPDHDAAKRGSRAAGPFSKTA